MRLRRLIQRVRESQRCAVCLTRFPRGCSPTEDKDCCSQRCADARADLATW